MITIPSPQDIEAVAKLSGRSMKSVCLSAGVAISTWTRWKSGETSPRLDIAQRIVDAAAGASKSSRKKEARP